MVRNRFFVKDKDIRNIVRVDLLLQVLENLHPLPFDQIQFSEEVFDLGNLLGD